MLLRLKAFLFFNTSTQQILVKNIFWLTASQMISRFARAFFLIYAARVLGVFEYGIFGYVLGLVGFFTIFSDVALNSILTREAAKDKGRELHYFATIFWLKIALLAGTALLIIFVAPLFSGIPEATPLIPFIALMAVFDGIRELGIALFRARERMEFEAIITIIIDLTIVACGYALIRVNPTAGYLIFSYIISAFFGVLIGLFLLHKEYLTIFSHFTKELIRPVVTTAAPIAMIGIVGLFMVNVDIIMLGWFRSAYDIGLYTASQRIFQLFSSFVSIIAMSVFPTLSRLASGSDTNRMRLLITKSFVGAFVVAFPLVTGCVLLAQPIIVFLYGQSFIDAASSLQILSAMLLIQFTSVILGNLAFVFDRHNEMWPLVSIAVLFNVTLNLLLIPQFGITGAAWSTVISQSIYVSLLWRMISSTLSFSPWSKMKITTIATIVMGLFACLLNVIGLHILVIVVSSAVLYGALLVIFKEPLLQDLLAIVWKSR